MTGWRACVLTALLLGAGCSGISVEREAVVDVPPDSGQVGFTALDGCCDLLVGGPARGQVDVVRRRGDRWIEVGSFFAARHPIEDLLPASVGGRPSVFVDAGEEVTLLSAGLVDPHRLRDPIRVYGDGDIHAVATGDLDRDGIDELVVAAGDRIEVVDQTERALFEDPSETADVSRWEIGGGFRARALGVGDMTGDGVPEVVAFHRDEPVARIYDSPGVDREERREPRDVELSAPAVSAVSVRCERAPVVAALEDGSVVGVRGRSEQGATDWPVLGDARALFGGGDAVVIAYDEGPLSLHDACGRTGESLGLGSASVVDVALTPRADETRRLAVLREAGDGVGIYRVESDF